MSNIDHTPASTRLALFQDQTPADCAVSIATLADFLAEIRIDDSDHFGLHILHGVIRDSSIALSQRLSLAV
jgi:hypothetical protein